jgi:uncharacterized membrane protein
MIHLIAICAICLILLVWFKTDAVSEYAQLFHVTRLFYIHEYLMISAGVQDDDFHYPDFLKEYHNNFFTKLIGCEVCTSVWLGLFVSLITGNIQLFPVYVIFGLLMYRVTVKLL